jgi:site-specific DNA-methyltransferase (adenine-specific)
MNTRRPHTGSHDITPNQDGHLASVDATADDTAPHYADDSSVVYRGDVLTVLRGLPDNSIDAVIADPPYASGGANNAQRTRQSTRRKYVSAKTAHDLPDFVGDNRDQRSHVFWSTLWLAECHRATKSGGVVMVFTDWRQLPAMTDALQAAGWIWRGIIAWHKSTARPQPARFTHSCEFVLWASKGALPKSDGRPPLPGMFSYPAPHHTRRTHITEKPVELLRQLTKILPAQGVILDPFAGSGSTGEAALGEGHRFIGIEISEHYADRITHRLKASRAAARASNGGGQ